MIRPLTVAACLLAATSASAHDWYSGLKAPGGGMCCSDRDCRPVDHRYNPGTRRLELSLDGVWTPVDPARVVLVASVDGAAHACFKRFWQLGRMIPIVRCVVLPGEA